MKTDTPLSVDALVTAYHEMKLDTASPAQRISFGTSGHRGTSLSGSFNKVHIEAITQAVCEYRKLHGITGPLFIGKDTHALSCPALETALAVLAGNNVEAVAQSHNHPTPTPVISRSILRHNLAQAGTPLRLADGIIITPSHNPPADGGFKYNEAHGGPASTATTTWIEQRANAILEQGNRDVRYATPSKTHFIDFIMPYVAELTQIIDMQSIAKAHLRMATDPLGGASLPYWEAIAEHYRLTLSIVNTTIDPLFRFMPPDHDGTIRMDCSSPAAMAGLISLAGTFDLAFGNDPDADRHGIVTPKGLLPPNHYLAAATCYLLKTRKWDPAARVGKTCVTTALIDRISAQHNRKTLEVPVGFKWFVDGLYNGSLVFGGEESAGASFLTFDGSPWSTDKDGILLGLLAAEMTATTGTTPAEMYDTITSELGKPSFTRQDAPATLAQKKALALLAAEDVKKTHLAGSAIVHITTTAKNNAPIGGLKVSTQDGWFAARPSGTESLYKIYAESFNGPEHVQLLVQEAQELVSECFARQSL